jgi:hypothetical protein
VVVEGNSFANYGNSLVLISNDACATSTDIEITENHSENTSGSSFFFGGNNITQLLIAGNEIVGSGGGNASGIRFSGDWLATPGVPLDDILIQDNDISGASFGVNVGLGVQLADDSSIVSRGNRYSNLVNFAINNLTTVDIHSRDDDLDLTDLELANVSTFVVLDLPTQAEPAAADPELAATGANDDAFMIGAAALSTLLLGLALALLAARRRAVLRAE